MSIVQNDNSETKIKTAKSSEYEIPAVIRKDKEGISFETSLFWALVIHPVVIIAILLVSLILRLLGIEFGLFHKPPITPKDIEFVLVQKENKTPINKNTKNRAEHNSRAGGKHDPNRAVSMPEQSAPKSNDKKPTPPAPAKKVEQPKKKAQQPQKSTQQQKAQPAKNQQVQAPKQEPIKQPVQEQPVQPTPAPKPAAPKPVATPAKSAPVANPSSDFNIPAPAKSAIPVAQPTAAPVTSAPKIGGGSSSGKSGSTSGGSSSAAPSFSPTTSANGTGAGGKGTGAGGGGRFSGTGDSRGNVGNPSPGNPNGMPGIDAIKEPDFGPYMKELQRRIKMNWEPPKGNESKRVVLLFSIARDGRLLNVQVNKSSGLKAADDAAINAVKLTAPFKTLPPEFRGDKVDILFTFDYTVFGVNGY